MENLEHDVVDATLDVVSGETCTIKKALPVLAPIALLVGLVFLGVKLIKKNKSKKAAVQQTAEEVNPEEPKE
jgi:hypothetical protein